MTSNDLKRPQMTSKNVNKNDTPVSKKNKNKKNLRGGDPNDNTTQGSVLIEKVVFLPVKS